ncbi:MAG TPA: hypothetical protein PLP42_20555 [Acidobacteriota bacterium]|nr:hypothetical protein [Acidobacteriota bacterium]
MKKSLFVCFLAVSWIASAGSALASQSGSGSEFEKIVAEYLQIHDALARDTTEGVDVAARKIVSLASQAQKKSVGGQSPDYAAIGRAAAGLQGKKLEQARAQFHELSKPIIAELKRNPASSKPVFTYTCSMAKKSWVQGTKEIRNPYYGSSMLKCGEPL